MVSYIKYIEVVVKTKSQATLEENKKFKNNHGSIPINEKIINANIWW